MISVQTKYKRIDCGSGGVGTLDDVPHLQPAGLCLSSCSCCSCLEGICLKLSLHSLTVLPVDRVQTPSPA